MISRRFGYLKAQSLKLLLSNNLESLVRLQHLYDGVILGDV